LGVVLQTNGNSHGPTINYHDQCPFEIPSVVPSLSRFVHDIIWPKDVNGAKFIDWKTFKANGANLGGWLEKERTHDPIW
jgi:glucan 1,3-beta-glucosidase